MTVDYQTTLAAHVATEIPDEHAYAALWSEQVSGLDSLTAQAVQGGLLADRMAWVFVPGISVLCAIPLLNSRLMASQPLPFPRTERMTRPCRESKACTATAACR